MNILAASGGAFVAGAGMKLMKSADGTSNPIAPLGALIGGIALVVKGKSSAMKALGYGLAGVGAVGVVGKVAEKVTALQRFTPSIGGLGDLYQDEDGNIIELGGLAGTPQLVEDENGNTYMIEGFDEDDELMGLYGDDYDDELEGLYGDDYDDELEGLYGDDDLIAA